LLRFAIEPLDEPGEGVAASRISTAEPGPLEVEGCRILEKIGEGGAGIVYRAEQLSPVRREVALKVIKLGMDTREVIARFEGERQALALMDHPNIAKVFSAGSTRAGRPCFLMELVRGVPITTYCDAHQLATRARLQLFIEVCHAVQHAHQKGIIHRDLKPSNVLVGEQNGQPVPKIIDFGIAKATGGQRLTEATLYTAFEQFLGTPAYMSPEQAGIGATDIDTRSDIYSLGVLLYELLTGALPYDPQEIAAASIEEIRRRIREEEPARPSAKLAALPSARRTGIALRRATEPRKLTTNLRGDLDWIVMQALEKKRERRYATAGSLAEDLARHLGDQPVNARPPGTFYPLQKFARRHKTVVVSTALIGVTLLAAVVVSTWQAVRARRAEKTALTESAKSRQIALFLENMLQSVEPAVAKGQDTTLLRDILQQASDQIGQDLGGAPEQEAPLRKVIGWTFHKIGDNAEAETNLREAVRLYRQMPGEKVALCCTLNWLVYCTQEPTEAETLAREAFILQSSLMRSLDKRSPEAIVLANNSPALASLLILRAHQNLEEAARVLQQWRAFQSATLGENNPAVARTLRTLARLEVRQGDLQHARADFQSLLDFYRKLDGENSLETANAMLDLGAVLMDTGDWDAAGILLRQSLTLSRRILGKNHPDLIYNLIPLAGLELNLGQLDAARTTLEEAMPLCQKASKSATQKVFQHVVKLADACEKQNRLADAETVLLEADRVQRGFARSDAVSRRLILERLVAYYQARKKPEQAVVWSQTLDLFNSQPPAK
jgi:serine/threonine protein kinase